MLRIILLSLFVGICSTCLVRPRFWKGVIKKYLFNDSGAIINLDNCNKKRYFVEQIICFILAFLLYGIYVYCSHDLYNPILFILICMMFQLTQDLLYKSGPSVTLIVISIIALALSIQDFIAYKNINVYLNKVESIPFTTLKVRHPDTKVAFLVSSNDIENLFKVDSATGPTYNNGKYIFTVSGGDTGDGIVIIDKANPIEANFIPCSYELDIRDISYKYPTHTLKELYITISDDNKPYALFATADKSWLLGTYEVNGYIMLNMVTGETKEFTQEQLPHFVTEN